MWLCAHRADAVFTGTVLTSYNLTESQDPWGYADATEHVIHVLEVWKGDIPDTVSVFVEHTSCFYRFDARETYVIFAAGPRDRLKTSMCRCNQPVENADPTLSKLESFTRFLEDDPPRPIDDWIAHTLKEGDRDDRIDTATRLLGMEVNGQVVGWSLEAMYRQGDEEERTAAVAGVMGLTSMPLEARQFVADALLDSSEAVQWVAEQAVRSFRSYPDEDQVVAALLCNLETGSDRVRMNAAQALPRIDVDPERVLPALERALQDTALGVVVGAAVAIVQLHPDGVEVAMTLMQHEDALVRSSVLGASTQRWPNSDTGWDLLLMGLRDRYRIVRRNAARLLPEMEFRQDEAVNLLLDLCADDDDLVRDRAVRGLGSMADGHPAAIEALRVLLDSEHADVRTRALTLLATASWDEGVRRRVYAACNHEARETREAAVAALAARAAEDSAAMRALVGMLDDPDPFMRYYVTRALMKVGPSARVAIPELEARFESTDRDRQWISDVLQHLQRLEAK